MISFPHLKIQILLFTIGFFVNTTKTTATTTTSLISIKEKNIIEEKIISFFFNGLAILKWL